MENLLFVLLDFTKYSMSPETVLLVGKYLLGICSVILALIVMYESGSYLLQKSKQKNREK